MRRGLASRRRQRPLSPTLVKGIKALGSVLGMSTTTPITTLTSTTQHESYNSWVGDFKLDPHSLGDYLTKTSSATGTIGFSTAQAFLRAGHIVYGQTRSESKVKQLATEESTCVPPYLHSLSSRRVGSHTHRLRPCRHRQVEALVGER